MKVDYSLIEGNLSYILREMREQPEVSNFFSEDEMSYSEQIEQISEWIEDAGEYGLAYETIVCLLEKYPFKVSGGNGVRLLEVGLVFGYKTGLDVDAMFDRRSESK